MSPLQIPNKTNDKPFVLLALNKQTKAEGFIQKSSRSLIRLRVFFWLPQNRSWPAFFRPMTSWSMASRQWPLGQPPVHGCLKVQTKRQTLCLEDLSGLEFSTFWFSGLVLRSTQKLCLASWHNRAASKKILGYSSSSSSSLSSSSSIGTSSDSSPSSLA